MIMRNALTVFPDLLSFLRGSGQKVFLSLNKHIPYSHEPFAIWRVQLTPAA